jgi:hypothetical protein
MLSRGFYRRDLDAELDLHVVVKGRSQFLEILARGALGERVIGDCARIRLHFR